MAAQVPSNTAQANLIVKWSGGRRTWLLLAVATANVVLFISIWLAANSLTSALASLLAGLSAFRVYSLFRSDAWLWKRGVRYREHVNRKPRGWRPNDRELLQVYQDPEVRGDFFPFGVRAIVIQANFDQRVGAHALLAHLGYRLWKFYIFAPIISVCTYVLLVVEPGRETLTQYLLLVAGFTLSTGALAIAAEAALSFFTFGSWSLAYHRFDVAEQRGTAEISALAGGVITTFISNASTIAVVAVGFEAYEKLKGRSLADTFGLGYYFTLTAFTGNGDPGPSGWAGYWQIALIYIQAAAYLLIVISLLLDSLGNEPGIHLPWVRQRRDHHSVERASAARQRAKHKQLRSRARSQKHHRRAKSASAGPEVLGWPARSIGPVAVRIFRKLRTLVVPDQ